MLLAPVLMGLASAAVAGQQAEKFSIISNMTINVSDLDREELNAAREYANCMSRPRFPTKGEYGGVEWKCSHGLPDSRTERLTSLLEQIRHIVQGHPGSEATLEIKKR